MTFSLAYTALFIRGKMEVGNVRGKLPGYHLKCLWEETKQARCLLQRKHF